jgi:hypothetical protein
MMTIANRDQTTNPETPKYVYESPDGGLTIFAREVGSMVKVMVSQDPIVIDRQQQAERANRLLTILRVAEKDSTLNDALGKLEALYILKYGGDDKND